MSTWQGISHARMTRSMHGLSGGAYKVLATVRRIIPDGSRRKISQAEIARKAGVSEGTVSVALQAMDKIYIVRHFVGRGRGNGYEIEMLPPPEQRPIGAPAAPPKGSESDPCNRSFSEGSTMPQTPAPKGSESDPSIFSLHAHEQQQQTAPLSEAAEPPAPADQLAPETVAALDAAGAHPKLIARVAANNPGCTPDDVTAALKAAAEKPSAHTPPGLALECLANRQQVIVPRARPEPPAGAGRRAAAHYDAARTDWAALAQAEAEYQAARDAAFLADLDEALAAEDAAARGGSTAPEEELLADLDEALAAEGDGRQLEAAAPPAPPAPLPAPLPASADLAPLIAEAVALLGDRPPAGAVERTLLIQCLEAGGTPDQAVAALRRRRNPPRRLTSRPPTTTPGGIP